MKNKIIIKEQNKETHEFVTLHQDREFFTVQAETRICYSEVKELPGLHYEDIWDTDLRYFVQGKQVEWKGFRELYEKLFGANSFKDFESNILEEFEKFLSEHHSKNYKSITRLTNEEACECMELLIKEQKISTKKAICNNTKKEYFYSSDWLAKPLCKNFGLYPIKKLNVPYTYVSNTTAAKEHQVVVLSKF